MINYIIYRPWARYFFLSTDRKNATYRWFCIWFNTVVSYLLDWALVEKRVNL